MKRSNGCTRSLRPRRNWSSCAISVGSRFPRQPRSWGYRSRPPTATGLTPAPGSTKNLRPAVVGPRANHFQKNDANLVRFGHRLPIDCRANHRGGPDMAETLTKEEAIFHAVLQIDAADQRSAYLDAACGNEQGLRQRVEALLRRHAEAEGPLDRPDFNLAATTDRLITERPGTGIGPYR